MSLPKPNADTTVVITGASSGIGAEIARGLGGAVGIHWCWLRDDENGSTSSPMSFAERTRSPSMSCRLISMTPRRALS